MKWLRWSARRWNEPAPVSASAQKMGAEKGLAGLVGQDAAVRALEAAAAKPVHAYLFVGPPGTGKLTAATAFAAMLLCPGGGDDGCETCSRPSKASTPTSWSSSGKAPRSPSSRRARSAGSPPAPRSRGAVRS